MSIVFLVAGASLSAAASEQSGFSESHKEPLKSLMYAPLKEDFLIHELKTKAQFFIKDLRDKQQSLLKK